MRPTPHSPLAASVVALAALAAVALPVSAAAAAPTWSAPPTAVCAPAPPIANGVSRRGTSPGSRSASALLTGSARTAHSGTGLIRPNGTGDARTDTLTRRSTDPAGCATALPADSTRTPSAPSYTVSLSSDTTGSVWTGQESVTFTNSSATALGEVYLRLWDNSHGTCSAMPIKVSDVTGGTAGALSADCTSLRITLPAPLAQGQSATIGFDLGITVPAGADRFGRDGAFSFVGNALPVLAVKDTTGWHLDPYTDNGESFYSLAADFKVSLDHPSTLLVPATGRSTDTPGTAGRTVTTATATQVRDFAWAAGPFTRISGTSAAGTPVNVYSVTGISSSSAQSMLATATSAVDAHAGRFGAYPYGELDAVIDNNFWFGGMEYPGFVLDVVSTTALTHEIGHQWWYGIVGDDEYTSPWLDEAFTDYATDLALGKSGSGCWNSVSWASSAEKITNSMAYWDAHASRYSTVVYGYGKCALHELRRVLGDTAMAKLLKDYATAHWYGVSTTAEFKAAAQAATGTDLTSFWTQHRIDG
ncbi:M1 family metallopeptidase [Streptomyces sp. NPDC006012]|uniref:M1 family metallopeptidase n=1 Tax=Streptomyces sp. NPDC006012 TaxID=3364739 RepID=UPI0036D15E7B